MVETATRDNLIAFAKSRMRDHNGQVTKLRISDLKMELPTSDLLDEILEEIREDMPHEDEYTHLNAFDCDDFSFIFKGLVSQWYRRNRPTELPVAVGVAWGFFSSFSPQEFHSLNFIFHGDDRLLRWIEPQFIKSRPLNEAMAKFQKSKDKVSLLIL